MKRRRYFGDLNHSEDKNRQFTYCELINSYGQRVVVNTSSLATEPCCWIFVYPGTCRVTDAHLTVGQAMVVRDALSAWIADAEAGRV